MKGGGIAPGVRAASVRVRPAARAPANPLSDVDTQLMLQVRDGSPDAANALIRRNFERVSRYIARVVRHPRCVEDLAQDVFLQVFKSAARYEPSARFSTWLYRIATNVARNHLNLAHVRKERASADASLAVADRTEVGPVHQTTLAELRERVSTAIGGLPINQRVALTLFQYEEFSYEQIAIVLDTTVEGVRALLKRAREALRDKLAGLI